MSHNDQFVLIIKAGALLILFTVSADDGKLLAKLPKVKVLRNEQREG